MDIGKTLENARIAKNLSLDTVAQETNIRRVYLDAIEKNDYAALPGTVFVKGIIRTYGNYLDLDGAGLVEEFKSAVSGNTESSHTTTIRESKNVRVRPTFKSNRDIGSGDGSHKKLVMGIFCSVIIVLAAACGIYYFITHSGQDIKLPISIGSAPAGNVKQKEPETKQSGKTTTENNTLPVAETGKKENPPAVSGIQGPEKNNVAKKETESTNKKNSAGAKNGVTSLNLTSTGKCWLRVSDSKNFILYEGTLMKGESRQFSDNGPLKVHIGNLKDLKIEHNGQALPAEATIEPVIRTYAPAGKEAQ